MSVLYEHHLMSIPSDLIVIDRIQSSLPLDREMRLAERFPTKTCILHVGYDPSTHMFAAYLGTPRLEPRSLTRWFPTLEQALVQTFRIYTYRLYISGRPQLWMEDYSDVLLTFDSIFQILPLPLSF